MASRSTITVTSHAVRPVSDTNPIILSTRLSSEAYCLLPRRPFNSEREQLAVTVSLRGRVDSRRKVSSVSIWEERKAEILRTANRNLPVTQEESVDDV